MTAALAHTPPSAAAKVAAVTLGFWIAKVAATTLGETGGDWVTMSLDLGYLVGTGIFASQKPSVTAAIFAGAVERLYRRASAMECCRVSVEASRQFAMDSLAGS